MSSFHIARYTAKNLRRGSSNFGRNKNGSHLTLGYALNQPPSLQSVQQAIKNAPASSARSLEAKVIDLGVVGVKRDSVSLAAIVEMSPQLRDEIDYFSDQLDLTPTEVPHITLAAGLKSDEQIEAAESRFTKRLRLQERGKYILQLQPVISRLRYSSAENSIRY